MARFRPARARTLDDQNAEAVQRIRELVDAATVAGAEAVPVKLIADLLNPRGMWRFTGNSRAGSPPEAPPAGADPLTGCMPVTAKPQG
jgi:hypothetical protein